MGNSKIDTMYMILEIVINARIKGNSTCIYLYYL